MRPIVGITPSPSQDTQSHGVFTRYCLNEAYAAAVHAAGGVPIVLPPQSDAVDRLFDVLDGLLLSGGADIDPRRYGDAERHPETYEVDPVRDEFEIALARGAVKREVPLLGICRGIQSINVALGGSLIQHLPAGDDNAAGLHHRQHEIGLAADHPGHTVRLTGDSRLRNLFLGDEIPVNSFHHQAIDRLAPGLVAAAYAPDNTIEAVVGDGDSFLLAVQWHPELMFRRHPEQLRPFAALVEAALLRTALASAV
ncbi:MAG: gamma-glutamyl-gamma-aminobutyrate hydrolase family protein [Thermomicrobiales bacterium]|nr:gamma-glutamyl-gamma-aminobutyrate hydrolase family protein [Thermomicrobiales bacterium]